MIKDFKSFISEALTLGKIGNITDQHYSHRVEDRLENLNVIGLEGSDGKRINVPSSELSKITKFFRAILQQLADHRNGAVFKAAEVSPNKIGLIRLAVTNVILPDGTRAKPIFEVYERKEGNTNKMVQGKYFWIFTIGSIAKTLKLYDIDGTTSNGKEVLINKSIDHLLKNRENELQKLVAGSTINPIDRSDLVKIHTVILNPAEIPSINLDLTSNLTPNDQIEKFIKDNELNTKEDVFIGNPIDGDTLELEIVPKQMNITPNKTWVVEWNDKFKTWGAMPILKSKQTFGLSGNEIHITVGKKWLHWLDWEKEKLKELNWPAAELDTWLKTKFDKGIKATFNLPVNMNRIIKKGDIVSLAKENKTGNIVINIGKVTDIGTDARSSEFPYVKTAGWDSTKSISAQNAKNIFVEEGDVRENIYILNFSNWLNS